MSDPNTLSDALDGLKRAGQVVNMNSVMSALRTRKDIPAAVSILNNKMNKQNRDEFINLCRVAAALAQEVNQRGSFEESLTVQFSPAGQLRVYNQS